MPQRSDHDELIELKSEVRALREDVAEIKALITHLVTQDQFNPIKTVVYGMCGAILIAVMGTMLTSLGLKVNSH